MTSELLGGRKGEEPNASVAWHARIFGDSFKKRRLADHATEVLLTASRVSVTGY